MGHHVPGLLALAALACCPGACRTTIQDHPFAVRDRAVAVRLWPERAFELVEAHEVLGRLVLFQSTTPGGGAFWSVRDPWHHELGMIDELGRIWRYRPHVEDPEWIGTGTVVEGARLVLGVGQGAVLREAAL